MNQNTTVGVIGLGIMGRPMAKNLAKNGFTVLGTDVNRAVFTEMETAGIRCVDGIADLAGCGIIIAVLPAPAVSLNVALGPDGVARTIRPGTLFIEMSSLSPAVAKEIHTGLSAVGIHMLDAPVAGGDGRAADGTLAIMAGGSQEDFDRAIPVFKALSAKATRVGDAGAGCAVKLANQIIVGANIATIAEAFALVAKAGVDPQVAFDAIRNGSAGSFVLETKIPMMLQNDFTPGARLDIHIKDMANVLETAHALSMPTPIAAMVMEMMQAMKANGMGGQDHACLVRLYEMMGNVSLGRKA